MAHSIVSLCALRGTCILVEAYEIREEEEEGASCVICCVVGNYLLSPYLTLMVPDVEEELEIKRFLKMVKQPGLATGVLVFSEDIAG